MLQRKKKRQTGAARGLRGVQTDGGYMGKVGGLCSLCPRTQTELRIDCLVLDGPLTFLFFFKSSFLTSSQKGGGGCWKHIHALSKEWKST